MGVDRWLVERAHDLFQDHPLAVDALGAVTALGKPQLLAAVSVVVGCALVARRQPRAAALVVAATIGAWLLDNAIKDLVDRARPGLAHPIASASGPSFPSGHAMTSAAAYGALLVVALPHVPPSRRPVVVGVTLALVVGIGITRVALGVHWPTDVLGGWVFGAAWLAACAAVLRPELASDCARGSGR